MGSTDPNVISRYAGSSSLSTYAYWLNVHVKGLLRDSNLSDVTVTS